MGMFKSKKVEETKYVICPKCGAGYSTSMVSLNIMSQSPFFVDLESWNTKIICQNCRGEVWVSGSRTTVFGEPRPR